MSDTNEPLECGDTLGNGDVYACEQEGCQTCCEHQYDDHCCLNCGKERDYGAEIDAAMARWEDR